MIGYNPAIKKADTVMLIYIGTLRTEHAKLVTLYENETDPVEKSKFAFDANIAGFAATTAKQYHALREPKKKDAFYRTICAQLEVAYLGNEEIEIARLNHAAKCLAYMRKKETIAFKDFSGNKFGRRDHHRASPMPRQPAKRSGINASQRFDH